MLHVSTFTSRGIYNLTHTFSKKFTKANVSVFIETTPIFINENFVISFSFHWNIFHIETRTIPRIIRFSFHIFFCIHNISKRILKLKTTKLHFCILQTQYRFHVYYFHFPTLSCMYKSEPHTYHYKCWVKLFGFN